MRFLIVRLLFAAALIAGTAVSCVSEKPKGEIVRIKGSDTMLELTRNLANEFMRENPGISIYVEGGGSAEGIDALTAGVVDIASSSRMLRSTEIMHIAENFSAIGMSYLIAKDALSVYANPENPIENVSFEDLEAIFTGDKKNWKEVGGEDLPITVYLRSPNSGTLLYFQRHVLSGKDFRQDAKIRPAYSELIESVTEDVGGTAFGGMNKGLKLKHLTVDGYAPTSSNVRRDLYPLTRYLHFYTVNTPRGAVKKFIDWATSKKAAQIISRSGYVPVWEDLY